jgi:hypothetical protein
MYVDKQAEFSDAQAVTASAISTNVMDLVSNSSGKNPLRDIGTGQDVYLVIIATAQATAAGAATVVATLESDSVPGLSTSPTTHFTTKAFSLAEMAPGSVLTAVKLPAGDYERYLGIRYTVATGPLTAGAFDAFLTTDVQAWRAYDRNYTV